MFQRIYTALLIAFLLFTAGPASYGQTSEIAVPSIQQVIDEDHSAAGINSDSDPVEEFATRRHGDPGHVTDTVDE
jgi:hypothetical protein